MILYLRPPDEPPLEDLDDPEELLPDEPDEELLPDPEE
jgi:hypothetical protein